MNCIRLLKKRNQRRVWTAFDRNRGRIPAVEVGEGTRKVVKNLLCTVELDKIKIVCTDGNFRYNETLRCIHHIRHVISKSETCLVESFNSVLRQHLARLHRRTKC